MLFFLVLLVYRSLCVPNLGSKSENPGLSRPGFRMEVIAMTILLQDDLFLESMFECFPEAFETVGLTCAVLETGLKIY